MDPKKAKRNLGLHGVSFDEASTALQDLLSTTIDDPLHSTGEERYVLTGQSHQGRVLVVVHSERETAYESSARGSRPTKREDNMKKSRNDPDMLEEYDFSSGVRGKYAKRYAEGANVVVIDPDVAEYFPDHDAVNNALRSLAAIIKTREKGEPRREGGRG